MIRVHVSKSLFRTLPKICDRACWQKYLRALKFLFSQKAPYRCLLGSLIKLFVKLLFQMCTLFFLIRTRNIDLRFSFQRWTSLKIFIFISYLKPALFALFATYVISNVVVNITYLQFQYPFVNFATYKNIFK